MLHVYVYNTIINSISYRKYKNEEYYKIKTDYNITYDIEYMKLSVDNNFINNIFISSGYRSPSNVFKYLLTHIKCDNITFSNKVSKQEFTKLVIDSSYSINTVMYYGIITINTHKMIFYKLPNTLFIFDFIEYQHDMNYPSNYEEFEKLKYNTLLSIKQINKHIILKVPNDKYYINKNIVSWLTLDTIINYKNTIVYIDHKKNIKLDGYHIITLEVPPDLYYKS